MIYTQQSEELLNELKLARGRNCLVFVISDRPEELKEQIESAGFEVKEIYLKGRMNLLEILLHWNETPENTIYLVHGISNQFPWVLPYINLHRDLFFDIKRPVVVVVSEYELTEIERNAPDWFRFRSGTYDLRKGERVEEVGEGVTMSFAESKPVYYPLSILAEESEEEIKERIKIDEYLLSSERDDYKRAELYMSLSLSYFKLGDYARGEEYLNESMAIREKLNDDKGMTMNYLRLSYVFLQMKEFEKAIEACNEILKLNADPDSVYAFRAITYVIRGVAYSELHQYERAIEDFSKAIELNPDLDEAYYSRGNAYLKLKRYKEAIEDFNTAIKLNPDFADAYYNRGNVYSELERYKEAIEDFNKAIELNPEYAGAYNNRGVAFSKLKRYKEAIEDFNRAITLNPDLDEAYNNRGLVYHELERYDDAIEDFNTAIELNPEGADAYYNRGNAYLKLKRYEEAIEDFNTAIKLKPEYAEAYGNRGLTYKATGDYEHSSRDLKIAGILFLKSGREEDAVMSFSICFDLREEITNDDVVYSGLALYLLTTNPDVIAELKGMRIRDKTLMKIRDLVLMKLDNEDVSNGIAALEAGDKREEVKVLVELLKSFSKNQL